MNTRTFTEVTKEEFNEFLKDKDYYFIDNVVLTKDKEYSFEEDVIYRPSLEKIAMRHRKGNEQRYFINRSFRQITYH